MPKRLGIGLSVYLLGASLLQAQQPAQQQERQRPDRPSAHDAAPEGVQIQRDLVYATLDDDTKFTPDEQYKMMV